MTKQQLPVMYKSIEGLDSDKHKALSFNGDVNYSYSSAIHSVPAVAGELPFLCETYPVAFAKMDDGSYTLAVVLGLKEDENAFVDADGNWLAEYLPSYIRQYPFISVGIEGEGNKKALCIDAEAPHFKGKDGVSLFDKDGNRSETVELALRMNEEFEGSAQQTKEFCEEMANCNVIEARQENSEYGNMQFFGFKVEALSTLPAKKISEWQDKGYLHIVFAIVHSGRCWREIQNRLDMKKNLVKAVEKDKPVEHPVAEKLN